MKKLTKILSVVASAALMTISVSCSKSNGRILYLYNWTYYTPDKVIKAFEKEFDCTVKLDTYSTCDEMYAKLRAGAKGYDVAIPSNDFVSIMMKQGMLRELDQTKMTNRDKINPVIQAKMDFDLDMKYSIPYALSATGVMVNKEKVTWDYARDYSIFSDSRFAGHATMMDDMREVIGCALVHQGHDLNSVDSAELEEAYNLVSKEWKPNLVKFDAEAFGKSFASGDFYLCQGYPEIVYGEVDSSRWADTIDFFIPPEGGPASLDCMVILKDAPHYELANEFINFIHRPEMYAIFIDTFGYPCVVNTEAPKYVTTESMYNSEQAYRCTLKQDLGSNLDKYNDIWQKIRFTN